MRISIPHRIFGVFCAVLSGIILSGCLEPKRLTFAEAVEYVVDGVSARFVESRSDKQSTAKGSPEVRRTIVVDPMLDGHSGQQTAISADLERRAVARLTSRLGLTVLPLSKDALAQADTLLVGTVAVDPDKTAKGSSALLQVALIDLKSGAVIAQESARATGAAFDLTPSRFDQDSPIFVRDKAVQGYIGAAATTSGQQVDRVYLDQLGSSASLTRATQAYNQARYAEALQLFRAAGLEQQNDSLRALNGAYLSNVRLGKLDEAEQLFGKIVVLSIKGRDLGVKFLFAPGSTEFLSDTKVSGMYDMWIRQIARALDQSGNCVELIGHASKTGAELYNTKLSEQRAMRIKTRLQGEIDRLRSRITASGAGSKETIIGTGTDDMRDAVDRRVAFKFQGCKP